MLQQFVQMLLLRKSIHGRFAAPHMNRMDFSRVPAKLTNGATAPPSIPEKAPCTALSRQEVISSYNLLDAQDTCAEAIACVKSTYMWPMQRQLTSTSRCTGDKQHSCTQL